MISSALYGVCPDCVLKCGIGEEAEHVRVCSRHELLGFSETAPWAVIQEIGLWVQITTRAVFKKFGVLNEETLLCVCS